MTQAELKEIIDRQEALQLMAYCQTHAFAYDSITKEVYSYKICPSRR